MGNEIELRVIGAGLSRTGTLSTRAALEELLGGPCYHGVVPVVEKPWHRGLWTAAIWQGHLSASQHDQLLLGCTAGVDYPFNLFWRQLMDQHPQAKVVLTVRDHHHLYQSLLNLFSLYTQGQTWPESWLNRILGTPFSFLEMSGTWSSPSQGLTLYQAVMAGEQEAVTFFQEWEAEVKAAVPEDRLLVFRVQEGWRPLAAFLGLPQPVHPFPNINDMAQIKAIALTSKLLAWGTMVFLPLLLLAGALCLSPSLSSLAMGLAGLVATVLLAARYHDSKLQAHVGQKGKKD